MIDLFRIVQFAMGRLGPYLSSVSAVQREAILLALSEPVLIRIIFTAQQLARLIDTNNFELENAMFRSTDETENCIVRMILAAVM